MAEILEKISIFSFLFAFVCFLLAILLWFRFKIPGIIGDLSGHTAKKSIAQIREANEKSGKKRYSSSFINQGRGKLTEKIDDIQNQTSISDYDLEATEKLNELKSQEESTDFLKQETEILDEKATQILENKLQDHHSNQNWVLLDEVVIVHTDEDI